MILSKFALTDRVAIVAGAGKGIGKSMALGFAEAGADVAVVARTTVDVDRAAEEIRALGRKALAVTADVQQSYEVERVMDTAKREFGRIDILVNNVGGQFITPFFKVTEKGWDAILSRNLKPLFLCCKAVYPIMREQQKGSIINISSFVAKYASPGCAPYAAAKQAVLSLTRTLAAEWGRHRIRVNAILPGRMLGTSAEALYLARQAENLQKVPLGRFGVPEDVVGAAIYLASDASDYVSGTAIDVDGGPYWIDM